jgi:hypothetical protein
MEKDKGMKKLRLLMAYTAIYLGLGLIPVVIFKGAVLPVCLSIGMVITAMVIFTIKKHKFIGLPLCAFPVILVIEVCEKIFQSAVFKKGQVDLIVVFSVGVCIASSIIAAVIGVMSFYRGTGVFEYVEQEEHIFEEN